nr:MAG TPA: hypothetical protein [Caudoviricetes sp.]
MFREQLFQIHTDSIQFSHLLKPFQIFASENRFLCFVKCKYTRIRFFHPCKFERSTPDHLQILAHLFHTQFYFLGELCSDRTGRGPFFRKRKIPVFQKLLHPLCRYRRLITAREIPVDFSLCRRKVIQSFRLLRVNLPVNGCAEPERQVIGCCVTHVFSPVHLLSDLSVMSDRSDGCFTLPPGKRSRFPR